MKIICTVSLVRFGRTKTTVDGKKLQLKKIIIKNKLVKECRPSLSTKTIKDVAINFPEVCTFFQINPAPSPKLFSRRLLKLNFLSVCWGNHLTQSWNILGKSYGFCVWENTTLCFDKIIWKQLQLRAVEIHSCSAFQQSFSFCSIACFFFKFCFLF